MRSSEELLGESVHSLWMTFFYGTLICYSGILSNLGLVGVYLRRHQGEDRACFWLFESNIPGIRQYAYTPVIAISDTGAHALICILGLFLIG